MANQITVSKEVGMVTKISRTTITGSGKRFQVYVLINEKMNEEKAETTRQEFEADWKGSIAKYGVEVWKD